MTKKKANIRPDLVGELFLKPGEDIPYRLILCNTEPTAVIQRVDNPEPDTPTGISGLSGLVLLKPIRPIEKPKKPRADLGGTHKKALRNQAQKETSTAEGATTGNMPDIISTFSVETGQDGISHTFISYTLKMGDTSVSAKTMKAGVLELLRLKGLTEKDVEEAPESEGKHLLLGILNPTP